MNKKYKGLTPHNDAKKGDIAKTVLMPGDPLRAQFIAKKYLTNIKEVNTVRGMLAYTGEYKAKQVTIMGSGMGMPSMGIYSSELFEFYDVDNIIRIGSTAAMRKDIKLYDILVVETSITQSNFHRAVLGDNQYELEGNAKLIETTKAVAKKLGLEEQLFFGKVYCSDAFYSKPEVRKQKLEFMTSKNMLGVEMEAFALYTNAKRFKKRALTILSVSDHALTGQVTTAQERQTSFTNMMELALNVANSL